MLRSIDDPWFGEEIFLGLNFWTEEEFAKHAKISIDQVHELIEAGLPVLGLADGTVRISEAAADKWAKQRMTSEASKHVSVREVGVDGRDPIERIEKLLEELVKSLKEEKSPYLTTKEAASYLKSTVQTVYDWVKRGKLHPVPGRSGMFTREALDRFALTRRRRK